MKIRYKRKGAHAATITACDTTARVRLRLLLLVVSAGRDRNSESSFSWLYIHPGVNSPVRGFDSNEIGLLAQTKFLCSVPNDTFASCNCCIEKIYYALILHRKRPGQFCCRFVRFRPVARALGKFCCIPGVLQNFRTELLLTTSIHIVLSLLRNYHYCP